MRKTFMMLAVVMSLFVVTGSVLALEDGVKNSPHNLSSVTPDAGLESLQTASLAEEDQICIFCHTPHNAAPAVPLWNRTAASAADSFDLYTSSTLNATTVVADGFSSDSVSLMCLSCHDGVTSLASYGNAPTTKTWTGTAQTSGVLSGPAALGTNLLNDHPVGIKWPADDSEIIAAGSLPATIDLFGATSDVMECASCHDVHNYGAGSQQPFLRVDNQGSGLCVTCHLK